MFFRVRSQKRALKVQKGNMQNHTKLSGTEESTDCTFLYRIGQTNHTVIICVMTFSLGRRVFFSRNAKQHLFIIITFGEKL